MAEGGSYIIDKPGAAPRLVERTVDHQDGNGPRPAAPEVKKPTAKAEKPIPQEPDPAA